MNSNPGQARTKTIILLALGGVIGAVIVIGVQSLNATRPSSPEQATLEAPAAPASEPPTNAAVAPVTAPAPVEAAAAAPQEVSERSTESSYAPPGRMIEYTQSASGYPIVVGRKAVDYGGEPVEASNEPVAIDESGALVEQEVRPVGRNGLIGNPAVDPPSSRGAAFGRAY